MPGREQQQCGSTHPEGLEWAGVGILSGRVQGGLKGHSGPGRLLGSRESESYFSKIVKNSRLDERLVP